MYNVSNSVVNVVVVVIIITTTTTTTTTTINKLYAEYVQLYTPPKKCF